MSKILSKKSIKVSGQKKDQDKNSYAADQGDPILKLTTIVVAQAKRDQKAERK